MSFQSVDKLQNELAKTVFGYDKDAKKASGRALGTFVEIISFYLLESWGLSDHISIEKRLAEYGNKSITHNVEFTLHPVKKRIAITIHPLDLPITSKKLAKLLPKSCQHNFVPKNNCLLSTKMILRNACLIGTRGDYSFVAIVEEMNKETAQVLVTEQYPKPFAMVECKRVGVEEGMRKGPQTIEKAKQGAYVAKAVSSLQKIRNAHGQLCGIMSRADGSFYSKPYTELITDIIQSNDPELIRDFILTVGVVSNHGNWFTSDNPNKEMLVLSQAYDWLVFLTDRGISEFIERLLIKPEKDYEGIRKAFLTSYRQTNRRKNRFTKVQMGHPAHVLLLKFFRENKQEVEKWFNVVTPKKNLCDLKDQLILLANKNWERTL